MDLPGHGEGPGLRGYIDSADALIVDGIRAGQVAGCAGEAPARAARHTGLVRRHNVKNPEVRVGCSATK